MRAPADQTATALGTILLLSHHHDRDVRPDATLGDRSRVERPGGHLDQAIGRALLRGTTLLGWRALVIGGHEGPDRRGDELAVDRIELGELSGPRLIDTGPATFELTVDNRGNVHRRFEEDTQLLASSGDNSFAFENFTVLGDSSRVVQAVWPDPPLLCWCTVDVEIDDGQGNLLVASTRVIAFPLRLSLALLALTVGLAIVAIGRRRRRKAKFDQQLEEARREGANTNSAPDPRPRRLAPRVDPPAQHRQPTTTPPPPTPAAPSAPLAHATTATILETSPSTPPTTELQPLDMRLFTAHGTHNRHPRQRRRRR